MATTTMIHVRLEDSLKKDASTALGGVNICVKTSVREQKFSLKLELIVLLSKGYLESI